MILKLFERKTTEKPASPAHQATTTQVSRQKNQRGHGHSQKPAKRQANTNSPAPVPWTLDQFDSPEQEGKTRFHDLGLDLDIMHAIADLGFQYCSAIQAQSLPHALSGRDIIGKAQTGTGKTAAFLIAIIDDLLKHPVSGERYGGEPRALIIAPTRELAVQISEDANALNKYTQMTTHCLVGGMDYGKQHRRLQQEVVDILVATPGRLLDFCGNQDVFLDQVEIMVIDEADRMLDMGFIPQVRRIIRQTPQKLHRQTLMFSATFTHDVLHLAEQWTMDAIKVEIAPDSVATDTVDQHVYLCSTEEKYQLLYHLLQQANVENAIVFANRRDQCRVLQDKLQRHGFTAGLLSGEIPQSKRTQTLDRFKAGQLDVLVATDVAGRGIHVDDISHVINYTLPEEPEDYVHRIGRTGRAGNSGTSISFACEEDAFLLPPIEQLIGRKIPCEHPSEQLLAETPPLAKPTGRATPQRRDKPASRQRRR